MSRKSRVRGGIREGVERGATKMAAGSQKSRTVRMIYAVLGRLYPIR